MAYNQNKPQATDQLSVSQDDLLRNFQAIFTVQNQNHVDFNATGQGKHKFIQFTQQPPAPDPITGSTDYGLFAKANANVAGSSQLYIREQNSGIVRPFTGGNLVSTGWSYIAPGLVMKWGLQAPPGGPGWPQVVSTTVGPAISAVLNIQLTIVDPSNSLTNEPLGLRSKVGDTTLTQFTINKRTNSDSGNVSCYWILIGAI